MLPLYREEKIGMILRPTFRLGSDSCPRNRLESP
jgi:hypothetical protein